MAELGYLLLGALYLNPIITLLVLAGLGWLALEVGREALYSVQDMRGRDLVFTGTLAGLCFTGWWVTG